jgi:hypothetical protein
MDITLPGCVRLRCTALSTAAQSKERDCLAVIR